MRNNKNSKFITFLVIFIFIALSYSLVKGFFSEGISKNILSKNGSFTFVYNFDEKILGEKYDDTRTFKVVMDRNYEKFTGDAKLDELSLKPRKVELIFNTDVDNPKPYKLTIKNSSWLQLYKADILSNKLNFAVLGSDLEYYGVKISIIKNTEEINTDNKEWTILEKKNYSIYQNTSYKVIDDDISLELELPILYEKEKYSKEAYEELRENIEKNISIEEYSNYEYSYLSFNIDDVKLSDSITLLLKNAKVFGYMHTSDVQTKLSYSSIYLINNEKNIISVLKIDDIDKYTPQIDKSGLTKKEYNYKGIKCYLLYKESEIDSSGVPYQSAIFEIDGNYYLIGPISYSNKYKDDQINTWIDGMLKDVLEIK